jgi:hypothetical protein
VRLREFSTLPLGEKLIFDGRFTTDGNMAHQIEHVVAQVLLARQSLAGILGTDPEIHVILRSRASPMGREIYRILGIPVILSDARIEGQIVRCSCPPTTTRIGGKFLQDTTATIMGLYPEIFRSTRIGDPPRNSSEKVFIARKSTRFLLNENEITQLLEGRGFRKYYFEEIPVLEQWQIMANARQIVAIHGAALAAMVFNRHGLARKPGDLAGLQLIELFGPGYQVNSYRHYAAVMNAHWCAVRGRITPKAVRDLDERGLARSHALKPFAIDPETLEMALEYSAAHCSQNGDMPVFSPFRPPSKARSL